MDTSESRLCQITSRLRENNYKLTPQRLAIAKVLAESRDHPDIETIYNRIKPGFPGISLATVYRNVMVIKSLGEVMEIGIPGSGGRYEGNRLDPHPHAVCERCKKIVDLEPDSMTGLLESVQQATGFEIMTHRLDFFGLCRECRKDDKSS